MSHGRVAGESRGQSFITPLTPNSNAVAVAAGIYNINQDTMVWFLIGGVPFWTTLISAANTEQKLSKKTGNSIVTLKKGLRVEFLAQGSGSYIVLMSGKIRDSGTKYHLKRKVLGIFNTPDI